MAEPSPYEAAFAEEEVELPELDFEPISDELEGLLAVGALSKEVTIAGHPIAIRTLTIGEELEASLIASKYRDTDDASRAYATAIVAAAVTSVDGRPLIGQGLGPNENTLERRYSYVRENWYWAVVRELYDNSS